MSRPAGEDDPLGMMDEFAKLVESYEGMRQQLIRMGWPGDQAARLVVLIVEHALVLERRK